MPNYSKNDIVLIRYPFSNLSDSKVRPAIVVNAKHISQDILLVPLISKTNSLLFGEFILVNWQASGLNVSSAVKRGIYTVDKKLVIKIIGKLQKFDAQKLENSLRGWLGL